MGKIDKESINLDFLKEKEPKQKAYKGYYTVVISDDDEEVHNITKLMLRNFEFEGRKLEFIDAYSGSETVEVLKANPDVAVLFLDVVMEELDSGLKVVEYLRKELHNKHTRIILRTGQPGQAPEEQVIKEYDINDYRLKTEMTVKRMFTTVYSALRNYRDLVMIDKHRRGLEKIIKASSELFEENTLEEFLTSILYSLSNFHIDSPEMMYIREKSEQINDGFVTVAQKNESVIIAATGKYEKYIGKGIKDIEELSEVLAHIQNVKEQNERITFVEKGFIVKNEGKNNLENYIFIEGDIEHFDFELINLFLTNYSVALDNYILSNMISSTQKEIIITLGEVVESHFDDTAGHVRRISDMMYRFGEVLHFSYGECELLRVASTMHDIGKIGIPDEILKKPGKLTEEEFEIVKDHSSIGYKILSKSKLELIKMAAELALWIYVNSLDTKLSFVFEEYAMRRRTNIPT